MVCHEVWDYDSHSRVATLTAFEFVCPLCNFSIHLGRTLSVLARRMPGIREPVWQHIAEVNRIPIDEVDLIAYASRLRWRDMPRDGWTVLIEPRLVRRFPQLEGLVL